MAKPEAHLTLELDLSKTWILLQALALLTSPGGEAFLREQFPNMNWDTMAKECEAFMDQIHERMPKEFEGMSRG